MKGGERIGPIQVIPPGLLGLFQLKGHGENPRELATLVNPILEMRDWYFQAQALDWPQARNGGVVPTANIAAGGVGFVAFSTPMTVPQDEIWYVHHLTIAVGNLAATDVFTGVATMRSVTGNDFFPGTYQGGQGFGGGANPRRTFATASGFWAPPGATCGAYVLQADTATTIPIAGFLRFTPMPI